jgi:hypothetical protein
MVFRSTQLGRFGELCDQHFKAHGDADARAAHALAGDGVSPTRPDLQAVLGSKMLIEDADPQWKRWNSSFSGLLNTYQRQGGAPLTGICTQNWPLQGHGFCMHRQMLMLRDCQNLFLGQSG